MSGSFERLSVVWAVVTGLLVGALIIVPVLPLPGSLQVLIVAGLYVLYLWIMLVGAARFSQARVRRRPVRFGRYPHMLSTVKVQPGSRADSAHDHQGL